MTLYKSISKNVYQESKSSFRVRFKRNGKTTSKAFPTKKKALEFRKAKLGF